MILHEDTKKHEGPFVINRPVYNVSAPMIARA